MAIVGEQLLAPETGWKRIDDRDKNFEFIGSDWIADTALPTSYKGTRTSTNYNNWRIRFAITGSKLRLITTGNPSGLNHKIFIDGKEYSFSSFKASAIVQMLAYDKTDLTNAFHNIEIIGAGAIQFDAIDIDTSGEIGVFKPNKTLISLNGTTKYYNAGWKNASTPPSKSDFETNGHDDLSAIPPEAWSSLLSTNPDIKLVTYAPTGNVVSKINATLNGKGLGLTAIPIPQFVHLTKPAGIYGNLSDLMISEGVNNDVINNTRYLISPNKTSWYTWNGTSFVPVDASVKNNILTSGMTYQSILKMQESQWTSWSHDNLYVGVYLDDNKRGKNTSLVDSIKYADLAPKYTTKVSDAKMYILNTTSTINVTFAGKTITGTVDDADSGKVQYRVLLNGVPYFPQLGEFTPLQAAPMNVALTLANEDILIDENNVLRIEFQDYWGATDYWQTNFVGTYSGLMFLDATGKYYSTDIGEILQYLDFGIIIAGQTTIEQAIVLRNTYGYSVNNILIRANQSNFPTGMSARFGTNEISFESLDELLYAQTLNDGEELTFYIRLATQLGVTPPTSGEFDIIVTADKVI